MNLEELNYKQLTKLQTAVRREWVSRNKQIYLAECFKVGDIVKFKGKKIGTYNSRFRHAIDGDIYFGEVIGAQVQRTGRIQVYRIQYVDGDELKTTARGIRQVEAATEAEAQAFKLIKRVKCNV